MSGPYGKSGYTVEKSSRSGTSHHQPPPQAFTIYQQIPMAGPSQVGGLHQQAMINHAQVVQPIMIPVPVQVGHGVPSQIVGQPFNTAPHSPGFDIDSNKRLERQRSEDLDYYLEKPHKEHSKGKKYEHGKKEHRRRTEKSRSSSRYQSHSEERRLHSSDRNYDYDRDYDNHSRSRSNRSRSRSPHRIYDNHSRSRSNRSISRSPPRQYDNHSRSRSPPRFYDNHSITRSNRSLSRSPQRRYDNHSRSRSNRSISRSPLRHYDNRSRSRSPPRHYDNHSRSRSPQKHYDNHSRSRSSNRHSNSGKTQFHIDISPERRSDRYVPSDSYSRERDYYRKVSMEREHDFRGTHDNRHSAYGSESSYKSRKRTEHSIPDTKEWGEHKHRKISLSCSPISHDSSHGRFSGEMKIHVGQGGRWIETNRDMSPISDHESFDDFEIQTSGNTRLMQDGIDIPSRANRYEDERRVSVKGQWDTHKKVKSSAVLMEDGQSINDHHTVLMEEGVPIGLGHSRKDVRRKEEMDYSRGVEPQFENFRVGARNESTMPRQRDRYETGTYDKKTDVSGTGRTEIAHRSRNEKAHFPKDEKTVGQLDCKVPNICQYHNSKGCSNKYCNFMHICKHFILSRCKFGDACTKSHNLFAGQPLMLLEKINNFFKRSTMPSESELILTLRDRIEVRMQHDTTGTLPSMPMVSNIETESVDENPEYDEFDARRYAGDKYKKDPVVRSGGDNDARHKINDRKDRLVSKRKIEAGDAHERNEGSTSKKRYETDGKRKSVGNRHEQKRKVEQLSPVSVENEDWETIDKYETISEEDFPNRNVQNESNDIKDELDDVSSEGSYKEASINTHSNVNLQYASNVAVPIGMDEPLVFNPNKGKSAGQTVPIYLVPVIPGQMQGQMMVSLDIAPPPTILEQVIQSLPPYEYKAEVKEELPEVLDIKEEKEDEKDDQSADAEYHREHNEEEPESEMKEPVKELWKFPHKGVLNMSVIDFVTETDAYQDELIAEIVKILLTLDLPYVTMKKLIAVIKDKLSIAIRSASDMRKILEIYPDNFKIVETVDSDDEGDDGEVRKIVQIQAKVGLGFCDKHGFLPFYVGKCDCNSLHICKFHFLSSCSVTSCKFGHTFRTGHNISVLKYHRLHRMTGEEIQTYMQDFDNRGSETVPGVCKFYNRDITGCYKGNSTDDESICHNLHICYHFAKGICLNKNCKRSHSIREEQPFSLLQKFGLDPNEFGDENILQLLVKKLLAKEEKLQKSEGSKNDGNSSKTAKTSISASMVRVGKDSKGVDKTKGSQIVSEEHDSKVPSVCKFYNNAGGCKKKDWGPEGICYFLHICQHFVLGDCKFGSACKRSHDLFSGHVAILLNRYGIDTTTLTAGEILNRLNKSTGTPVEIPKLPEIESSENSSDEGVENSDGEVKNNESENNENVSSDKTVDAAKDTKLHNDDSIEAGNDVAVSEMNDDGAVIKGVESNSEVVQGHDVGNVAMESGASSGVIKSAKKEDVSFRSCNIEEVIQHIINEKRVDKVKHTSDK